MSKVSIQGDASGTGTLTIAAPNTNSNYTLTLPTNTGTVVTTAGATFTGDLTLESNGIYLGGTTSANYLDDYEEGTWTPTLEGSTTNPTVTYGSATNGSYVKTGNLVTLNFRIDTDTISGGTGNLKITGIPFNSVGISSYRASGICGFIRDWPTSSSAVTAVITDNSSFISLYRALDADDFDKTIDIDEYTDNTTNIFATITYRTS